MITISVKNFINKLLKKNGLPDILGLGFKTETAAIVVRGTSRHHYSSSTRTIIGKDLEKFKNDKEAVKLLKEFQEHGHNDLTCHFLNGEEVTEILWERQYYGSNQDIRAIVLEDYFDAIVD